ncbi:MAG: helix-turn-helix transcriptional regulator [Bacillota bacterium]|nr:helix-turn-helix transcriptional regulator [Bacillota bacterium]
MEKIEELISSFLMELRRGAVILAVLSQLSDPQYGYSLVQILEQKGFPVEPGTLYPLLRRLEKQGLLESSWDTSENRPRKFYKLSRKGNEIYKKLTEEWQLINMSMHNLINPEEVD